MNINLSGKIVLATGASGELGRVISKTCAVCGTDIANAVAFLASDLASFIIGAYIPVCGRNVMPTI